MCPSKNSWIFPGQPLFYRMPQALHVKRQIAEYRLSNTALMSSLEKSRKLLEQKGPTSVLFSCLIVTGTVMLTLF
jgi:hypothetical protein